MPSVIRNLLAAPALLAASVVAAPAQEMLANGTFETGLQGWSSCCASTGTASFNASGDAAGSALSGAARLTHVQSTVAEKSLFVYRCISGVGTLAGKAFFFGAKVRFLEGEKAAGRAFLSAEFRPDGSCAMGSIGGGFDDVLTGEVARGAWVPLTVGSSSQGIIAPAGANSIRVHVVLTKAGDSTLTIDTDDVFAAPAGTPTCDGMPATHIGTASYDFINGTDGSDVIVGRGGIDWIDGKGGNDRICGGPGNDALYGGPGDDRLFGGGGQDTLQGAAGRDVLSGGANNDTLEGGPGNDKLRGGTGIDSCYSNVSGNDVGGGSDKKKSCELPAAG